MIRRARCAFLLFLSLCFFIFNLLFLKTDVISIEIASTGGSIISTGSMASLIGLLKSVPIERGLNADIFVLGVNVEANRLPSSPGMALVMLNMVA